jgi:hypothetical protein
MVEGRAVPSGRRCQRNGAIIRIRRSDHETEKVLDLKNFVTTGYYGAWYAVAPDDSPIMLRNAGTQDVRCAG